MIKVGKLIKPSGRQIGKSNLNLDSMRVALPPGVRISKNGKKYTENRRNRSDLTREEKPNKKPINGTPAMKAPVKKTPVKRNPDDFVKKMVKKYITDSKIIDSKSNLNKIVNSKKTIAIYDMPVGELNVYNSYDIKDDLKKMGFQYGHGIWSIVRRNKTDDDLKKAVDGLNKLGVIVKMDGEPNYKHYPISSLIERITTTRDPNDWEKEFDKAFWIIMKSYGITKNTNKGLRTPKAPKPKKVANYTKTYGLSKQYIENNNIIEPLGRIRSYNAANKPYGVIWDDKLHILNSYSIKEDLKDDGYKFDKNNKSWYILMKGKQALKYIEYFKKRGIRVVIKKYDPHMNNTSYIFDE